LESDIPSSNAGGGGPFSRDHSMIQVTDSAVIMAGDKHQESAATGQKRNKDGSKSRVAGPSVRGSFEIQRK